MTSARRLARLEGSLDARTAVFRWLAEAHAFGSLPAYLRSVTESGQAHPLARIAEGVETMTRKAMRGHPRAVVGRAVRDALREAAFLFYLVLHLDAAFEDLIRSEGLRLVALTFWMRELTLREELAKHSDAAGWRADARSLDRSWQQWHEIADGMVGTLAHADEARRRVERRYLGGRDSLFPEQADEWRMLPRRAEVLSATRPSPGDEVAVRSRPATKDAATSTEGQPNPDELVRGWVGLANSEARMFID